MHIFIDARFYGTEHTGLGRYTQNVLIHLPSFLPRHRLTVLVHPDHQDLKLGNNCRLISSSVRPYSFWEQLIVPYLVLRSRADLYFGFHFNIPLFVGVPFVAVIHDLIKSYSVGPDTTTRSPWIYRLKRWGYELAMRHTATQAKHLLVPSNTVKNDLLARYNLEPSLIGVIPESIDPSLSKSTTHRVPFTNYLLYVGNAYPHKNLPVLLAALSQTSHNLVMVSKRNNYLDKVLANVSDTVKSKLYLIESVSDQELASLYQGAVATVMPSLMEGYGLPGIESLSLGTPVIAADIPVFREVYAKHALYFDPHSPASLVRALKSRKNFHFEPFRYLNTWGNTAKRIASHLR